MSGLLPAAPAGGEGLLVPRWEAEEDMLSSSNAGAAEANVEGMVLRWPRRSNIEGAAARVTAEDAESKEALGDDAPEVNEGLCCSRLEPGAEPVVEEKEVEE